MHFQLLEGNNLITIQLFGVNGDTLIFKENILRRTINDLGYNLNEFKIQQNNSLAYNISIYVDNEYYGKTGNGIETIYLIAEINQ